MSRTPSRSELDARGDFWCVHRTPFGSDHPKCKLGIEYATLGKRFVETCCGHNADAIAKCSSYRALTTEEIETREQKMAEYFERIGKIREAICDRVATTGQRAGKIDCPCCRDGVVSYSQASNNHIHAACSTAGCARWME